MFVTWPRDFTYGCTGELQEHISSDTPFLHITLQVNTQSLHTMIVQYVFLKGGQYCGKNDIIFTEPTCKVLYITQVERGVSCNADTPKFSQW